MEGKVKSGDEIRIKWNIEYYFLHGLRLMPYKLPFDPETEPAVFDAWFRGRQN